MTGNDTTGRTLVAIVDPAAWPDGEDPRMGTSRQGVLDVSYAELVRAFGHPGPGDGYKVDAEWTLMFESDDDDGAEPVCATIYNYKTGPSYGGPDALPVENIRDWHIGGTFPGVADLVRAALRERSAALAAAAEPASGKHSVDMPADEARATLQRFRDEGLLWLVNTAILHPRGYALSVEVDEETGQVSGSLGVIDFGEYSCFDVAEIGDTFDRYTRAEIAREAERNGKDGTDDAG